jgi:hypothetical protein
VLPSATVVKKVILDLIDEVKIRIQLLRSIFNSLVEGLLLEFPFEGAAFSNSPFEGGQGDVTN